MNIEQSVVRVYNQAKQVVGAGFLVNESWVLTCAHVVSDALGSPQIPEIKSAKLVMLDFPLVCPEQFISAQVVQIDASLDVACMKLLGVPVLGVQSAPLVYAVQLWGHTFQAFGFPQGKEMGVWADGEMRGPTANGWVQVEDVMPTGSFILPGFSGGPVWDKKLNGVAGMIVAVDTTPGDRVAFMIPTQILHKRFPGIPEPRGIMGPMYEVPRLPEKYLPRPVDLDSVKGLLLSRPEKSIAILGKSFSIGLHGMGGIGKSVLVAAVAQDIEVRWAFPDGVIWLTLGQEPNLVARQEDLARSLGEKEAYKDELQGKARLRDVLLDKACLIVLDDVWQYRHVIDGFDCLGPRCRMLITTRNREVVDSLKAVTYTVDVLSEDQSLEVIALWAGQLVGDLPPEANEIAHECGYLPLALAMVGALILQNPDSWGKVLRRLKNADLDKIRHQFPDYPYPDLLKAIQVSVDALPRDWRERYLDLAVFPEEAAIPAAVLQMLWKPQNIHEDDLLDLLEDLVKRSLARRDTQNRLVLHDLQRDYLLRQTPNLSRLHRRLVEAYRGNCLINDRRKLDEANPGGSAWALGPRDGYYFDHIAYHLVEANDWDDLFELLTSFDFLEARIQVSSVYSLGNDYRLALKSWGGSAGQFAILKVFEERLRLEAGRINHNPELLFPQLYNHLTWLDSPKGSLHTLCEEAGSFRKDWLRGLQDPRIQPQLWLWALESHSGEVRSVAVTTDGRQIVSGSEDNSLKVWDMESGNLLHTLEGHYGPVDAVAVTPDGLLVISGSEDNTLKAWDLNNGRLIRTLESHTGSVNAVAITPDGRQVVSGSEDFSLKIWDLESGRLIYTMGDHSGEVRAVVITPDGRHLVSGSEDNTIKIWDLKKGHLIRTLEGFTGGVKAVAITPDGRQVVFGLGDHTIKVWDLEIGRLIISLEGHNDWVNGLVVTPDGRQVVSGSGDRTLKVWDLESGRLRYSFAGHAGSVNAVTVTPDGQQVISVSSDHTLKVWNLEKGKLWRVLGGHSGDVKAVAITPDGRHIVSGSEDNTIKIWDLKKGHPIRTLEGHIGTINAIAVTPDGRQVVSGSIDNSLKVWEMESGHMILSIIGHTGGVTALSITPDGQQAISLSRDHTLKVWELESGRLIRILEGFTGGVNAVAITPDGRQVVSESGYHKLKVWDLGSGRALRLLEGHTGGVKAVAITPNGRQVVSGLGDHTIKVWDLKDGRLIHTLEGHNGPVNAIAITPDGRQAVSGSEDHTLKVWDLENGHLINTLEGNTGVINAIVVTPDGQQIISLSGDHTLKVWDLKKGRQQRTLEGHSSEVRSVTITSDGKQIVSGSEDYTVKVWGFESGHLIRTLEGHTRPVTSVTITSDGKQIVSGSEDYTVKVWDFESGNLIQTLEGQTGRVNAVAVTPDGHHIVCGLSNSYMLWDLKNWDSWTVAGFHNGPVTAVVVTPDGRSIVSGSYDKKLAVWDISIPPRYFKDPFDGIIYQRELFRILGGHSGEIRTVAITPDGKQIVSGSKDYTVKVWDFVSGRLIRTLGTHTGAVNAVAVTPDGKQVVSGSTDKTIRLWNMNKEYSNVLFWNDAPIYCLALSLDGRYLCCGDSAGRVWTFEWKR